MFIILQIKIQSNNDFKIDENATVLLRHKPKGIVVMIIIDYLSSACEDTLKVSSLSAHAKMTLILR